MSYTLSEEEILQLIGLKAGILTDTVSTILDSERSIEDLDKEVGIVEKIDELSQNISQLASELKKKADLRNDSL